MHHCSRCGGLMRREAILRRAHAPLLLWACWACGDRIDETIWFNRSMRRAETITERNDRIMRELQLAVAEIAVP